MIQLYKKQLWVAIVMSAICYQTLGQAFITTWKTDNPGTSEDNQITIPNNSDGIYDIYWEEIGDDTNHGSLSDQEGSTTITFPHAGSYRVEINGNFHRIYFNNQGDKDKILTVEQWGSIQWTSMARAFYNCTYLNINATDNPDLSGVIDMSAMFSHTSSFNQDIGNWDVSNVKYMNSMFENAQLFNQYIGNWDVSGVTNMNYMFYGAYKFNQDIGHWDVSNITSMAYMFSAATSFNQDIGNWDVSNVTRMNSMFEEASSFNRNIGGWDVSSVEYMDRMFSRATLFNQDIGDWNVSNVRIIRAVFAYAKSFDQDIGDWDVSNVGNMDYVFFQAQSFNQDIGRWDVSRVVTMAHMFSGAFDFNQDIGDWDVGNVKNMEYMFYNAVAFNQDIGRWDVSKVREMGSMFATAYEFNNNIGHWDVSSVTDMERMFRYAHSFNQDLSLWDVGNVSKINEMFFSAYSFNGDLSRWNIIEVDGFSNMFQKSSLSVQNYDRLLIALSNSKNLPRDVQFEVDDLRYCQSSIPRQKLIDEYGWTFIGDTYECEFSSLSGRSGAVAFNIGNHSYSGLGKDETDFFNDWLEISDGITTMNTFPGAPRSSAVSFVIDTLGYVGLGIDEAGNYLSDFYRYNPGTDTWTQIADFGGGPRTNAVVFSIGEFGYVGTGLNAEDEQADFWKYDPVEDIWTELPDWDKDKRQGAFAFVVGDKAYVGGGYYFDSFTFQLSDIQEYDSETGEWTEKIFADGLNLAVNDAAAFSLFGNGYIAYGNQDALIKYNPYTNEVENLGDYFELGDNRKDPIAFASGDFGYFGFGSYGFSPTEYSNEFSIYYEPNVLPTDINLSGQSLPENSGENVLIGGFSTEDLDQPHGHTYHLISNDESEQNNFEIIGDDLYALTSFDFETQNEYSILVRTLDSREGVFEKEFFINIADVNEAPVDIDLVLEEISESAVIGTLAGTFSTVDEDMSDQFIYSATSDTFYVDVDKLLTKTAFDLETDKLFTLEITSEDQGGLTFSKVFEILVTSEPLSVGSPDNFTIYPNPATDYLILKGDKARNVTLFTIAGEKLLELPMKKGSQKVDISQLKTGVYLLRLSEKEGVKDYKLIKQ